MSSLLKNKQTGKVELVSDPSEIATKIQSGQYEGAEDGGKVAVTDRLGRQVVLDPDLALEELASGGTSGDIVQRRQISEQENREANFGGAAETVRAFGEGALDAATLGAFSAGARALGLEEGIAAREDVNPVASGLGTAVGAIGSSLGGIGLAGRAASIASRAGTAVRSGTASRLIGGAAEGLIEGAVFGAGQGLRKVSLGSDPITVESIASALAEGAISDGLLGAAGGAALSGMASVAGGLSGRLAKFVGKRGSEAKQATRAAVADEVGGFFQRQSEDILTSTRAQKEALKGVDNVPKNQLKDLKKIEKLAEKASNVSKVRDLSTKLQTGSASSAVRVADNFDELYDSIAAYTAKYGDESLVPAASSDDLRQSLLAREELKGMTDLIDQITLPSEDVLSETLQLSQRGRLGPKGARGVTDALLGSTAYLKASAPVESSIRDIALRGAGAAIGASVVPGVGLGSAVRIASTRTGASVGSNLLSQSWDLLRTKGADVVAENVARINKVSNAIAKGTLSKSGATGVGVVSTTDFVKKISKSLDGDKNDPASIKVARHAQTTAADESGVRASLEPILLQNPQLGEALVQKHLQKMNYLANTAPRSPFNNPSTKWKPSPSQEASYGRRVRASEAPMVAIASDTKEIGYVSSETRETIKLLYPQMWKTIQENLISNAEDLFKLPYSKRRQITLSYEVPLDEASMDPVFANSLQSVHAERQVENTLAPSEVQPKLDNRTELSPGQKVSK